MGAHIRWQDSMFRRHSRGRSISLPGSVLTLALILATFGMCAPTSAAGASQPPGAAKPNVSTGGANGAIDIAVTGSALSGVTSSPLAVSPAFSPSDTDYVWYCASGTNELTLKLSSDGTITSGAESGSEISISISVVNNQAVVIRAPGGVHYWIRCLPAAFPQFTVTQSGDEPSGYYLTETFENAQSPGYPLILNSHGTPVWYLNGVPRSLRTRS